MRKASFLSQLSGEPCPKRLKLGSTPESRTVLLPERVEGSAFGTVPPANGNLKITIDLIILWNVDPQYIVN